jgi:hypothetical protein
VTLVSHKTKKPNQKMQEWADARRRHRLSQAQVQMACELGMNPKNLRKLDNHKQEPWKLPLPRFIEELYAKRFGKEVPGIVMSIEQRGGVDQKRIMRSSTEQLPASYEPDLPF